jgi:sterol desaturase/sphingolipid hydroxylase (fatty acid hydroxylase superfamily)
MTSWNQLLNALRGSYVDFALAVPLVAAGIVLLGSFHYVTSIPREERKKGLKDWVGYLVPPDLYASRSARIDIWVWLINGLLVVPLFQLAVMVSSLLAGDGLNHLLIETLGRHESAIGALWAIVAIQFAASYLGQGFGQYWSHLAFHKMPVLWAIHRAHHSAESANLFAFLRSHPIEIFLNGAARVGCGAVALGLAVFLTGGHLLPETVTAIVWYNAVYVIAGGFRSVDHTHIPIRFGMGLDIALGSPVMHQVHHSAELRHRDVNMGGGGYLFDWIFGTVYVPKPGERWRWGLNEDQLGDRNPHQTLGDFFTEPVREMIRVGRESWSSSDRAS